jgi:hypothetical protein
MMRGRTNLGRVVARRILSEQGVVGREIAVSIGLPRPDRSKKGDWECPFLIEGVGKSKVQKAFGIDSMQALIEAIQGLRVNLEQIGRPLFFLDPEFGTDIAINVPTSWGKKLVERVRLAIEREIVRVWRGKIKAGRAKIRAEEAGLKTQRKVSSTVKRELAQGKKHLQDWERDLDKLKPGWSIPAKPSKRRKR